MRILHFVTVLLIFTTGCSTVKFETQVPSRHILMVNSRGKVVDPTGNKKCSTAQDVTDRDVTQPRGLCNGAHSRRQSYDEFSNFETRLYVRAITEQLKVHAEKTGSRKILVFIHGGLNNSIGSIQRATCLSDDIAGSGYYPIFINWKSSLLSSYGEHIFFIRQGEHWGRNLLSLALSPFYFGADLTRAIIKTPVAHFQMIRSDLEGRPGSPKSRMAKEEAQRFTEFVEEWGRDQPRIDIHQGRDLRRLGEYQSAGIGYTATLPTKLLTVPIIDGFGANSWETMIRRSRVIFHTDEEMSVSRVRFRALDPAARGELTPLGGGSILFQELLEFVRSEKKVGHDWEIALVAHSMGTIVANEVIRNYSELPINNIVYMAAAASLRDYEDTIFPYLRIKNCAGSSSAQENLLVDPGSRECDAKVRMYHLTLHRAAEVRDTVSGLQIGPFDLAPRGSLLVWIDNYLSRPNTPLDRTAGRFVNLMTEIHNTPKDIAKAISIREFDIGREIASKQPQKHGDFGSVKFWDPECWKYDKDYDGSCYSKDIVRRRDPGACSEQLDNSPQSLDSSKGHVDERQPGM